VKESNFRESELCSAMQEWESAEMGEESEKAFKRVEECYYELIHARQAPAPVEVSRLAEDCKREARHLFALAPDAEDMAHLSMAIDRLAAAASTPVGEVPAGSKDKAWSCQSGADYLAGKNDVGRCETWCGDETKCTTSAFEPPPASSMFRCPSLAHESNGGSDYCYHCGIDMCDQGGVNGQCPSLKRQYDTLVKEGKIAPFPDIAASPAPVRCFEFWRGDVMAYVHRLGEGRG